MEPDTSNHFIEGWSCVFTSVQELDSDMNALSTILSKDQLDVPPEEQVQTLNSINIPVNLLTNLLNRLKDINFCGPEKFASISTDIDNLIDYALDGQLGSNKCSKDTHDFDRTAVFELLEERERVAGDDLDQQRLQFETKLDLQERKFSSKLQELTAELDLSRETHRQVEQRHVKDISCLTHQLEASESRYKRSDDEIAALASQLVPEEFFSDVPKPSMRLQCYLLNIQKKATLDSLTTERNDLRFRFRNLVQEHEALQATNSQADSQISTLQAQLDTLSDERVKLMQKNSVYRNYLQQLMDPEKAQAYTENLKRTLAASTSSRSDDSNRAQLAGPDTVVKRSSPSGSSSPETENHPPSARRESSSSSSSVFTRVSSTVTALASKILSPNSRHQEEPPLRAECQIRRKPLGEIPINDDLPINPSSRRLQDCADLHNKKEAPLSLHQAAALGPLAESTSLVRPIQSAMNLLSPPQPPVKPTPFAPPPFDPPPPPLSLKRQRVVDLVDPLCNGPLAESTSGPFKVPPPNLMPTPLPPAPVRRKTSEVKTDPVKKPGDPFDFVRPMSNTLTRVNRNDHQQTSTPLITNIRTPTSGQQPTRRQKLPNPQDNCPTS